MIVGSGMVARAFGDGGNVPGTCCIYAAGVSNSSCRDVTEFVRDRSRLESTIDLVGGSKRVVYISTCSVATPSQVPSDYVRHKKALEDIVLASARDAVIVRLPQLAGRTPNPHTLLNFLYARIARSERFDLWVHATRNVIDVDHVTRIVAAWLASCPPRGAIANVANPTSNTLREIVAAFELVTARKAVYSEVAKSSPLEIDVSSISDAIMESGVRFGESYLTDTIKKYYARRSSP